MEMEKAREGGALVKYTGKQDKIAVGLGAAGLAIWGLHVFAPFIGVAASIGALLLSWESASSKEKRTALAAAAFAMGAVPLAFDAVGWGLGLVGIVVGLAIKLAIVAAIVGGVCWGGRALYRGLIRKEDVPAT